MSYIISDESGTCAALPRRDSWGTCLTVDHWTAQVEPVARSFPLLHPGGAGHVQGPTHHNRRGCRGTT